MSGHGRVEQGIALAMKYFGEDYNCTQSAVQGVQAAKGIEDDALWLLATGFGGGIARKQGICGAVAAAVMMLGPLTARERNWGRNERKELRDETYRRITAFCERFEKEFGALDCRTLTGYDFGVPGGYEAFRASGKKHERCDRCVSFAVATIGGGEV